MNPLQHPALWSLFASSIVCALAPIGARGEDAPAPQTGPGTSPPGLAYWAYVGTYTGGKSKGVYRLRFDSATGTFGQPQLFANVSNPSFLAPHPNGRILYALVEDHGKPASVRALSIAPNTGGLVMNQQPTGGNGPCYLKIDQGAKNVLVANYGDGSLAVLPIGEGGLLSPPSCVVKLTGSGPDKDRQSGPHAHCIDLDPSGKFALACDLGTDMVRVYRFDPSAGTLTPNDPPAASVAPGSGPRHLAFHPSHKFVYVISEMAATVTAFSWDGDRGAMSEIQTVSTLPEGFHGKKWAGEIAVDAAGTHLYASNRGHDCMAVFTIDEASGKLTLVQIQPLDGKTPRHFAIDPTGSFLVDEYQDSDSIEVFRIDRETGKLSPTGVKFEIGSPVCVVFIPAAI